MGFTRNIERDRAILGSILNPLGLPTTTISLLLAHAEAVRGATQRLGLISPGDADHVVPRHTADSMLFALARGPQSVIEAQVTNGVAVRMALLYLLSGLPA